MKTAAIIALAGTAALATAGITNTYGPGAGNAFVDNATVSSSIVIADSGTIADLDVQVLGMVHSWVGDLQITLTHEDSGTSVMFIDRPGFPDSTFGDNVDTSGDFTFDDEAMTSFDDASGASGGALDGSAGPFAPDAALAGFDGLDIAGTWTLSFTDNAGGDSGQYEGWNLIATIPAPGAVALAGMGGLVAARRRRA